MDFQAGLSCRNEAGLYKKITLVECSDKDQTVEKMSKRVKESLEHPRKSRNVFYEI
jgi:hypothetical protein